MTPELAFSRGGLDNVTAQLGSVVLGGGRVAGCHHPTSLTPSPPAAGLSLAMSASCKTYFSPADHASVVFLTHVAPRTGHDFDFSLNTVRK